MIAHFDRDYSFYFEYGEINDLLTGTFIQGRLSHIDEPVEIMLKNFDEIGRLKERRVGTTIFSNEADLVVIHWEKEKHKIFFLDTWFKEAIKTALSGKTVTLSWGAEKIDIMAGYIGVEAKRFKAIFSS
jgi:hypothetical protein